MDPSIHHYRIIMKARKNRTTRSQEEGLIGKQKPFNNNSFCFWNIGFCSGSEDGGLTVLHFKDSCQLLIKTGWCRSSCQFCSAPCVHRIPGTPRCDWSAPRAQTHRAVIGGGETGPPGRARAPGHQAWPSSGESGTWLLLSDQGELKYIALHIFAEKLD